MARYQPGDVIACYTVVAQTADAPAREHRRYLVQAQCCGREMERSEETLADYGRRPRARCLRCAQAAAGARKRAQCAVGEVFGPVAVLGPGEREGHWRVRWDCCGAEAELARRYLVTLRTQAADGKRAICSSCAAVAAKALGAERQAVRRAARVAREAALRRQAARRQAAMVEKARQYRGTAKLEPGVISAAVAWPRPGAGA